MTQDLTRKLDQLGQAMTTRETAKVYQFPLCRDFLAYVNFPCHSAIMKSTPKIHTCTWSQRSAMGLIKYGGVSFTMCDNMTDF